MPDVELAITNEAHEATEIAAQDDFSESYVFQADATTGPATASIDGLRGRGLNTGIGVLGVAPFFAVVGEGLLNGCVGRGPTGGAPAITGVTGLGLFGVDAVGTSVGLNAAGGSRGVLARGTEFFSVGVEGTGEVAGVVGQSDPGVGVSGQSRDNRGGVFGSGRVAQLQLVPSEDLRVPLDGKTGDLYVHLGRDGATLYLCVLDNPVFWREVQLGSLIAGGQIAP
ncbi:MAG: hypothetical protein L0Z62_43740 [Gemmataceae bacterium]|nr:hypothetical protein [Gemmataceae bacterium]